MVFDIRIGGEGGIARGIAHHDALPRAQDIAKNRLRQHGRADRLVNKPYRHACADARRPRLDPLRWALRKHEQTAIRPRLLDGGAHEHVDQLVQIHFAGNGLRQLDYRGKVQLFDRVDGGSSGSRRAFAGPQARMRGLEQRGFGAGPPFQIALMRVAQIRLRSDLDVARGEERRRKLAGKRLVVNETIVFRRANSLFVKRLRLERTPLDTRDLRAYERRAALEIVRTIPRPGGQLPMMNGDRFDEFPPARRRNRIAVRGKRQGRIEVKLRFLEKERRCPQQRLRSARGIDGVRIATGQVPGLQLSNPVPALGDGERAAFGQALLQPGFAHELVVETAESGRAAAQRANEGALCGNDVDDETETRRLRKREAALDFVLSFMQRRTRKEQLRVEVVAGI